MTKARAGLSVILFVSVLLLVSLQEAWASERTFQEAWCNKFGGETEFILSDRTRVDCLLDTYAIEFDYAKKWAEAVGQSLLYASRTDRRPGIVLIMRSQKDCKYLDRLREVLHYGGLGMPVWETGEYAKQCPPDLN